MFPSYLQICYQFLKLPKTLIAQWYLHLLNVFFKTVLRGGWFSMLVRKKGCTFLKLKLTSMILSPYPTCQKNTLPIRLKFYPISFLVFHLFSSLKRMFPTIFGKLDIQSFHCYVCEFTKHHHVSFPSRTNKCSIPFSLIHIDVWGLTRIWSIYGAKWFVSFIDDAQGLHGYFLWNTNLMLALCFPFFIKW